MEGNYWIFSLQYRTPIFLESVETNKVSLEWIVANIFKDEELENVHCTFPKAVHTAINILKDKICRENYIDT